MTDGILAGIRILDLTTGLAGPLAVRLLAEAGAEVIKVEPPGGDPTRSWEPAGFASWNRSKASIVLNLKEQLDREKFDQLLSTSDVLVHGLRPSKTKALGLDDDTLRHQFPGLICSSLLGYPIDHPDAELPGYDILVQARSGSMDEQQGNRPGPVFQRLPVPSWGAVYLLASGIVTRLIIRGRSGKAGPVHTSLLQGALAPAAQYWQRAERPPPWLQMHTLPKVDNYPSMWIYRCSDDEWIQTMAGYVELPLLVETMAEMGRMEPLGLLGDPVAQHEFWSPVFRRRPAGDWLAALHEAGVPATHVLRLGDAYHDEQARLNGYVTEVEDSVFGPTLQAGPPFGTTPPSGVRSPAPRLGEHDEISEPPTTQLGEVRRSHRVADRYPLSGVRVLDFGMYLAGPFATQCLADMGAEVIKVEPITGDKMRQTNQFTGCQHGKRSLALDLHHPASRPVLRRLVQWADIVHHNIRMPAARRLGIAPEALFAIKNDLIYSHTGTYGPLGPKKDYPGYDPIAQAASGWEWENAGPGNPPMWMRNGMMDNQCGFASLVATLLALYRRDQTGEGSLVTASLLGAGILTASETLIGMDDGSAVPIPPINHDQTGIGPGYRIYEVDDGWIAVAAIQSGARDRFIDLIGIGNETEIARRLRGRPTNAVLADLAEAGVPAEAVVLDNMQRFFDDEANRKCRLVVTTQTAGYGALDQIGAYWNFGDLELNLDIPIPDLGQHSTEILLEVGLLPDEIRKLTIDGVLIAADLDQLG